MAHQFRIARRAKNDIASTLEYTRDEFGQNQHDKYRHLIMQTIADIADDPEAPPSKRREKMQPNIWTRHLGRHARHVLVYRIATDNTIEFVRLLHDSADMTRHLPDDYLR